MILPLDCVARAVATLFCIAVAAKDVPASLSGGRFVFDEIAALNTWANSGLMPQVRHGGNGKDSLAIVGSKLEGTGFENEQILQTHTPLSMTGVVARAGASLKGLGTLETGDDTEGPRLAGAASICCLRDPYPLF